MGMATIKKKVIHTIPVGGGEPLHQADVKCWCFPLYREDGVAVHNAKDSREKLERQGLKHGGMWALVVESSQEV